MRKKEDTDYNFLKDYVDNADIHYEFDKIVLKTDKDELI